MNGLPTTAADECLRCGYLLHSIPNDQPCPECGLIAERSRRMTDELHDTRPQWLRSLAWGVWLLLAAIVIGSGWPFVVGPLQNFAGYYQVTRSYQAYAMLSVILPAAGMGLSAILFFAGVMLLTVPERYEPADRADRRLRVVLRGAALAALLAMGLLAFQILVDFNYPRYTQPNPSAWQPAEIMALALGALGILPMPLLLFTRLRGLAKRARSAHFAEHCMIVGIGLTLALLYAIAATQILAHGDQWFGSYWIERSNGVIGVMLVMSLLASLFLLWSLYLMIRFGWAFRRAGREMRRKWKAGDRSVTASPIPMGSH